LNIIPAIGATLTESCGPDPSFICELLFDTTGNEDIAEFGDVLLPAFRAVLILLIGWVINRIAHRLINRSVTSLIERQEHSYQKARAEAASREADSEQSESRLESLLALAQRRVELSAIQLERSKQRAQTVGTVLRSGASLVIFTIAALMALSEFGVSLGPLIASAGIIGIALGFGAQSLVKDFLSGIFMLVEDQYGVGDIVDVGDASGLVEEVKLRTTKIRDVHGTLWHIPNGEIRRVGNKSQEWARAVLDIEVAYDTDLAHASRVIKEVADSVWRANLETATVLEEPEIWGVENFGPDAIAIRLALKVEPAEQFRVAREVRRRLKAAFEREGIEIPFPQRTVWMHQVLAEKPKREPAGEVPEFESGGAPGEVGG
jgi:small conductance mechanosensitive channel